MFEFPTNNVCPLIKQEGQISVTVNPLCEWRIHNGFRSGTDSDWFGQVRLATLCDPGDFWAETFDMVLFFVEGSFSHKHREVAVLNAEFFYSAVKEFRNLLPNKEGRRSKDVATWNLIILNHVRLCDNLGIPFAEILLLSVFDTELVSVFLFLFLFFWLFFSFGGFLGRCLLLFRGSSRLFQTTEIYDLGLMVW